MKQKNKQPLIPKLRFPEFRDAGEWSDNVLDDVSDQVGERIAVESLTPYNYVSTENILSNYSGVTSSLGLPSVKTVTRYQRGDVLLANIRPYLKKVWISDREGGASNDVIVFRPKAMVQIMFHAHVLRNDVFINYVMKDAKGVKMPRGDTASMGKFFFPLPSPAEQQKIAACLTSLDDLIAAHSRKLAALRNHKKGLMQQLFPREGETQPRLRFPEFRDAGEWEENLLGQLIEIASGQVNPKQTTYRDLPQVGSENIESHTGKLINVKSARDKGVISGNYVFDENDILYSKIRPALNKVAPPPSGAFAARIFIRFVPSTAACAEVISFICFSPKTFSTMRFETPNKARFPRSTAMPCLLTKR